MNTCEKHPQRQKIVDAIINGESCKKIAAWMRPPVHHSTVSRFRRRVLQSAMSGLQQRRAKDNSLREIAETSGVTPQRRYTLSGDTDAMRTLLFDRVERRISRRESWISDAEEFPVIDPKTGDTLCKLKNHKALASHDKNEAGDLEFLAKLANLLGSETNAGGNISINIAFPVLDSSQAAALEQAPTIDLPPMAKRLLQRPSDGKPK